MRAMRVHDTSRVGRAIGRQAATLERMGTTYAAPMTALVYAIRDRRA